MNKYHIVFKDHVDDFWSKGFSLEATDEIEAIKEWRQSNKTAVFFAIYITGQ